MIDESVNSKTLTKNSIKKFVLRIDLIKTDSYRITQLAESMTKYFDRSEKRQLSNFTVMISDGNADIKKGDFFNYVLISEKNKVSLTFSEGDNAFWIESNVYQDNKIYKEIISNVTGKLCEIDTEISSRRIGLRYINEFRCEKLSMISKIFGQRLARVVKSMISTSEISRAIGVEEYNNDGFKIRIQYGIPNAYYPSKISVYDLLFDIDSYIDSKCGINEWEELITNLNHGAYRMFENEMNPNYLGRLR